MQKYLTILQHIFGRFLVHISSSLHLMCYNIYTLYIFVWINLNMMHRFCDISVTLEVSVKCVTTPRRPLS